MTAENPLHISQLDMPEFDTGEPLKPKVRQALPNPYEKIIADLQQNSEGYSPSKTAIVPDDVADIHKRAIQRAAKSDPRVIGVSIDLQEAFKAGHTVVTFGLVPARVRKSSTDETVTSA